MSNESMIKAGKILEKKYAELKHKYDEVAEALMKLSSENYGLHLHIDEANVRINLLEKALILACRELSYRDSPKDNKHISAPRTVRYKQEFMKKAGESND